MQMTRLHIRGSFFGPLFVVTLSALSLMGSFSGSIPCSWLSRSSGSQLSLFSLMLSVNLAFVIEYSLPLIEIHLVIIDAAGRISVYFDRNLKDISTIPGILLIIFNNYICSASG